MQKQQNKTTPVQSPLTTTLGQETRWAYSTTFPSPQGAAIGKIKIDKMTFKVIQGH